jgi:hypothetical protein
MGLATNIPWFSGCSRSSFGKCPLNSISHPALNAINDGLLCQYGIFQRDQRRAAAAASLPRSDRLVVACSDWRKRNVRDFPLSNANFIDLREGTRSAFEDLAGVFTFPLTLQHEDGTPVRANAAVVTTNFFRLLGGRIAYGH